MEKFDSLHIARMIVIWNVIHGTNVRIYQRTSFFFFLKRKVIYSLGNLDAFINNSTNMVSLRKFF